MDVSLLVWAVVIVMALQPMVRQRMLETMRQRQISKIERARKSRVILLVHREERGREGECVAHYAEAPTTTMPPLARTNAGFIGES